MESLLCNTPAAVLEGALLGSAAHISAHTGALLKPGKEAEGLLELIERSGSMNPREFCISNGWDHRGSSRMLNNFLRDNRRPNEVWTRDITEMQWRPNPCYLNEETRLAMRPFYQAFSETYGVPLYETTWP